MIPSSISRTWNLREVDVSRKLLSEDARAYLAPMVEEVSVSIRFSPEAQEYASEGLFDPALLHMYSEAKRTHDEMLREVRKVIDKFNESMLKHATASEKHTVFLLTKETSVVRKPKPVDESPPAVEFDVQSVATTTKTRASKKLSPVAAWMNGIK